MEPQQQQGLAGLPSRGIMGVVDGVRPMPAGPGPAYICCHSPSPQVIVCNPTVRLVDLYKHAARKRGSTATAGAAATAAPAAGAGSSSGVKRPGEILQQDQAAKRQQQQGLKAAAAAATGVGAGTALASKQQQQQHAGAAIPQQQQQQRAAVPLGALPNATNTTPAAAAGAGVAAASGSVSKQLLQYSPEQMLQFSNKRLTELLKGCGLKVAGKKEDLVRRLMEYQRRVRKAAQGSGNSGSGVVGLAAAAGRAARV